MKTLRKRKTKNPCEGCGLHRDLCICAQIPSLNLKTRICLVVHKKELKRTTNTGRLAVKCLVNCEMRVRGDENQERLDLTSSLNPAYQSLLLSPVESAVELNADLLKGIQLPIQLIIPDGNWRQASKVNTRHPELKDLLRVKISSPNSAENHLRTEHLPEGMSTLEAIAAAIQIIEGVEAARPLFGIYQLKLRQTLIGRGVQQPIVSI